MQPNQQDSPWTGWVFAVAAATALASFVFLENYKPHVTAAPPGNTPGISPETNLLSSSAGTSSAPASPETQESKQPSPNNPASQPKPRQQTHAELMGVDPIQNRLGDATPTGRGIVLGIVEGNPGQYAPELTHPFLEDLTLKTHSGPSKPFAHTTTTATTVVGRGGLAPGIEQVHFFAAPHWLNAGLLHSGLPKAPEPGPIRLFTHSWIGGNQGTPAPGNSPENPPGKNPRNSHIQAAYEDALRRVDYMADAMQVLCVVGVNNGRESVVPSLLGSAYNSIAVGTYAGNNSGGYTTTDGPGRCKPDLIATVGRTTSVSTPAVAGIAARLMETADRMPAESQAGRVVVIRAVMLAGAAKSEDWKPQPGKPLDEHQGAGYARFDNSYLILTHGPIASSSAAPLWGWDRQSIAPNTQKTYSFEVTKPVQDVSIVLAWNRRIDGRIAMNLSTGQKVWLNQPRLADMDLTLIQQDSSNSAGKTIAVSSSKVDNLEHLYFRQLPVGRYQLTVNRVDTLAEPWEFALAWRWGPPDTPEVLPELPPELPPATPEVSPEVPPVIPSVPKP